MEVIRSRMVFCRLTRVVRHFNIASICQHSVRFYVNWLASLIWMVTAGHEQMGAVEVYAQDASWTAFKWLEGLKPNETVMIRIRLTIFLSF